MAVEVNVKRLDDVYARKRKLKSCVNISDLDLDIHRSQVLP